MSRSLPGLSKEAASFPPGIEGWISDLARMVAIDTSFPPGAGYDAFADLMEELLAPLGFVLEQVELPPELWRAPGVHGPRVNLIARRSTGRPVCSIYFHVDTAPAGDGWTVPPFALTRDGLRLIGRGVADMKGTIAAALAAIRHADAAGLTYAYDPHLLLCTDEEGGKYPGVRYLAERGLIEGHVLCLNGSAGPRIWAGCFGSVDLEIRVEGLGAHSGEGRGVNAAEVALPILTALVELKGKVERRASALPAPPNWSGPLHARLNVTAVHAGAKGSAVPGLASIIVNRRYTPEESFEAVQAELEGTVRRAARACGALSVTTEIVGHLTPVREPDAGLHWPRWIDALRKGFGYAREDFRRWGASSSSDMGFVQDAAGQQEILLGGLGRPDRRIHGPNEFTTIADVEALTSALVHYLTDPDPPEGA